MLIVEVDRPDRRARRAHGKSDPLDAFVTEAWHLRKQQKFRFAFHKLLAPTWFRCQGFE